ncbi:MAG TPA: TonB-dependent receptor [Chitinophagaceae bacterium]|nr:TonB-dependent receptor [Chitinophagaceae bacterium]
MRKLLMLLASAAFISATTNAQKISGVVKDEQGKGLEKTTVTLLRAKDSSTIKFNATDKSGKYAFTAITAGQYLISVTHVGYLPAYSKTFDVAAGTDFTVPDFSMIKSEGTLGGVSVSSAKPMVEVKADKMILNVEGTINATGNDAFELLRKSPGVLIDKDDNLSLAGKNGVQVYIDGKPTPLAGADLAAYLKSLQSSQIEAIEIITNPSAKYDAAGNAGIINIKLKKNKAFGTNGSLSAGYNIGIYPKYNGTLSLNHRNKKINVYGNYNYNNNKNEMSFNLFRDVADTLFDQHSKMLMKNESHGFKAGVDYFASARSTFGVMINGNINDNNMASDSRTDISYKPTKLTDRLLIANNRTVGNRDNANFNLNYRYADTAGREFNLDADYGLFRINTNQLQPNYYYDQSGTTLIGNKFYRFISPTEIDIYTLKGDYEQNFKKGRLGIGFKTSLINTDNTFNRYDVQQLKPEVKQLDVDRSNQFNYYENINAAYVNYNRQFKGVMVQAGVRVENTHSRGDSYGLNADGSVNTGNKQSFKRTYTDVFPSAALSFNKNPMSQWGISYSRRIDRPAYQDLNPFEFKLDEYTFMKGNTDLRPQYSNVFSVSNTYKYKLTTKLSYSHVADVFAQLPDVVDSSKAFMTKKNLANQDVLNLNISYPFMYKNYMAFINASGTYQHYEADLGTNKKINLDAFSYNIYMQHSLKFGKKKEWTAEVSGWYNSPGIWGGTFESKSIWSADAGIQKTIFKGAGNFKVSMSDVFYSLKWQGTSNFAGQRMTVIGRPEARQLRTSLTWRFGSNQVKAARQRKLASEEEANRTQSSGGIGGGN